ncbi:hypothetical protein [Nakamurella leprariae]|uniref:Uncharacterized protein n=1 Tax=Nakamurella leprariae TaxID=2803911 RepID=A0A938YBE1_9ACTN|nr:hypothetical protein [Nakamurella leprariae]MBM9469411.1 hypothetical protein [Nakamurella leprariae]
MSATVHTRCAAPIHEEHLTMVMGERIQSDQHATGPAAGSEDRPTTGERRHDLEADLEDYLGRDTLTMSQPPSVLLGR